MVAHERRRSVDDPGLPERAEGYARLNLSQPNERRLVCLLERDDWKGVRPPHRGATATRAEESQSRGKNGRVDLWVFLGCRSAWPHPHGLWLHGSERGREIRVEVPYDEIASAERAGDQIGTCPAIRIQTRAAGTLLIASISGVGVLGEILERVTRNVGLLTEAGELAAASGASA